MFKILKLAYNLTGLTLRNNYCNIAAEKALANSILAVTEEYNISNDLSSALETSPILLDYPPYLWERTIKTLHNHGFKATAFVPMIVAYPNLLQCKQSQVDHALSLWRNCQFGEHQLQIMLAQAPVLLEAGESNIFNRIPKLEAVFGTKNKVSKLLINSPNIIFESWDRVEQKIKYLLDTMKVAVHEIVKSSALSRDLSEIQCRHIFLERLGIYEPRKKKSDPNLPSKNPHLSRILDTTDYQFVKEVANITFEEFMVFKEMYQKEFDDEDSDFDMDRI